LQLVGDYSYDYFLGGSLIKTKPPMFMRKLKIYSFILCLLSVIACEKKEEVVVPGQTISLRFERISNIAGRTQNGPGIRKGYAFTGRCFEYGTIITDSNGVDWFYPAPLSTKMMGLWDICPDEGQGWALVSGIHDPNSLIQEVPAKIHDRNLVSPLLRSTTALQENGQTLEVFELIQ
jgi:hypothetical protein